jgi:hypothetical protein
MKPIVPHLGITIYFTPFHKPSKEKCKQGILLPHHPSSIVCHQYQSLRPNSMLHKPVQLRHPTSGKPVTGLLTGGHFSWEMELTVIA